MLILNLLFSKVAIVRPAYLWALPIFNLSILVLKKSACCSPQTGEVLYIFRLKRRATVHIRDGEN